MRRLRSPRLAPCWTLGLLLAVVPCLVSCEPNTDVVPVLPPLTMISTPDVDGFVRITGDATPRAQIFAFNENTERGVIETASAGGFYMLIIQAETGHSLVIWQRVGNENGQPRDVTVP